MAKLKAPDPMAKFRLKHCGDHYELYVDGLSVACLREYAEIVSKSKPRTYDQVLIGEVLGLFNHTADSYNQSAYPDFLSAKAYNDLKFMFRRSRKAGKAKALDLAKQLYLDDFNRMVQTCAWVKASGSSSRVLKLRISKDSPGYAYLLRFTDGVDSITINLYPIISYFPIFWYFKTQRFKEIVPEIFRKGYAKISSSIQGVEKKTLLKALELALRCDTTLGTALFLMARE